MALIEFQGELRELVPGQTTVGSGSQAAWRIQNADLSARHFTVRVENDDAVTIAPHSAQHIVVVNGRQVPLAGVELADGDQIAAGGAVMTFVRDGARMPEARPAAAAQAAFLVDAAERVAYPLQRRTVTIGRDSASSVALRDPAVSRFHADVRSEAGQHVLYAMGSSGTRVNGQPVSGPRLLEEGDEIGLGDTTLRYTREAPARGITVQRGGDAADDRSANRATMVAQQAVTSEFPSAARARGRLTPILAVAAGIAVGVGLTLWFVMGR